MRRALLTLLLLQLALAAPAAAAPDPWVRWSVDPASERGATVRSIDFTAPGVLFAGSEDDGVFKTNSGGVLGWAGQDDGLTGITGADNIRQVVSSSGSLYAATSAGIFKKAVNGETWMPHGQGAEPGRLNLPVQYLHFNSGSDVLAGVAAASPGVYRSTDGGEHWVKATGLAPGTNVYFIHPAGGVLFAATDGGVYRSLDGGSSWMLRSDGLPFANAYRMAGGVQNLFVATTSGIFRSINGGETWVERNGDGPTRLGNTETLGMISGPEGFGAGRLLVSTGQGVWASRDNGATWGKMAHDSAGNEPDLGGLKVWTLGFNIASPGNLLAGTQGHGVYRVPFQPVTAGGTAPSTNSPAVPRVGNKLVGTEGSWNGTAPFFFSFMWMRCPNVNNDDVDACSPTGDTDLTHVVVDADKDKYLRLRVTATGLVPPDPPARFSAPSPKISAPQGNPPTPPGAPYPRILGPDQQNAAQKSYFWGEELTVQTGTWSPAGTTYTFQWFRCPTVNTCTKIPNATSNKYTPTGDDALKRLQVEITGTANGNSQTITAGPTFEIREVLPENVQVPRVVGDPYVGSTLSSWSGQWKGRNITYFRDWQACDADGTGCNAIQVSEATYTINKIYLGKRLRLRVQVSNADGTADDRTAYSELTPVITEPPVDPPPGGNPPGGNPPGGNPPGGNPPGGNPPGGNPPGGNPPGVNLRPSLVLPRRVRVGATLKAPSIPGATKVRYQWLRNGKPIKGAKKRSYRVRRADRGKRLACRISFVVAGRTLKATTKAVKIPARRRSRRG